MSNVSGIIKSIQDIMRKDVGVDGDAQRISQLVWMFFLKIFDDREAGAGTPRRQLQIAAAGAPALAQLGQRPGRHDRRCTLRFREPAALPDPERKAGHAGRSGKRALVVRNVFEDAYNYMKSGTLMRQVINKICEIDFNNTADRHTFGSIYEQILQDLQSAGNAGEFYTPRAVTHFIVNRIDPKLDETVLDPACGTGGFLTCTIDHKRRTVCENHGR